MTSTNLGGHVRAWRARREYRRHYRSAMAVLKAMSPRDLLDIDMHSGDFPEIAAEMARK